MGYVYPGGITANTRTSLTALVTYLKIFVAVIWVMGVIVLLAVFASSVNERKREFAYLQASPVAVIGFIAVTIVCSTVIGIIGSLATMWRLGRPEAYLTLREGE